MKNICRAYSIIALGLATPVAMSCGSVLEVERETEAPIQTDRLRYEIERSGGFAQTSISYTYTNSSTQTWFIANCNGATLVRLEKDMEGVWLGVWGSNRPDCASPPIEIAPGASIESELLVFGGFTGCGCAPQFGVSDLNGVYRLVLVEVWASAEDVGVPEAQLAIANRVSNRFGFED